ncbi:hypothetical protein BH09GEM1_BH09GEM1_48030 [soil metagenome]
MHQDDDEVRVAEEDVLSIREPIPSDITAEEYGRRRAPKRTADWVRDACRDGRIPGARKDGSSWLIPASALSLEKGTPTSKQSSPDVKRRAAPKLHRAQKEKADKTSYPRWN